MNLILKIYQIEIEKYLIKCETVIKYALNKVGLLSNILGIFQQSHDEFLFKVDYKKYLYENNTNNVSNHNHNNMYFNTKSDLYNTVSTNETQFNFNERKSTDIKNIEDELKRLFFNSIKIIIRQEKLNNEYIEKIISVINKENKDNKNTNSKDLSHKPNKKMNNISSFSIHNSNNNNSVLTTKSNIFKNKVKSLGNKLLNKTEEIPLEDSIKLNLYQEKNSIKYRLMFLNCFIVKYIKLINECFDTIYNNMDEWIIMNLKTQNNKLNEFITYLKRALDKSFESINMEGRDFNYNDNYIKNKKFVLSLFKTIYPDEIMNLSLTFTLGDDFQNNLVKLNSLNLVQQYVYNLNDLIELYHSIKEYGIKTCEYFVKYDIVKNIFINKVINEKDKEYILFYGNNKKKSNIANYPKEKNNNKKNQIFNGVCKRMKFYSNKKIDDFIKIFSVYEKKYININYLFTTLLIIGSELISSENFYEQISPYLPNNEEQKNKNKSHMLLSLDQFRKIKFWFENDDYLNELSDISEQQQFQGKYNSQSSINQVNNGVMNKTKIGDLVLGMPFKKSSDMRKSSTKVAKNRKINKIKEEIFDINKNKDGLFDINIFGQLLDLLNNYSKKKEEEKKEMNKKEKENKIDIDEDDKCLRFSSDDLDDYIYMNKKMHKQTNINYVINSIFNNIFEK